MKILYGVQGTGNGHISRACAMADALQAWPEIEVTWLLSGRNRDKGCGTIASFEWRRGLTFVARDGGVKVWETLKQNGLRRFSHDVRALDLHPYDHIITDFEPVVAHAARTRGVPVTGIGHQYAFGYRIPLRGANLVTNAIMRHYAPVTTPVGLHWHHFGAPILPPIINLHLPLQLPPVQSHKVLVYLPFENAGQVQAMLAPLHDHAFYIYHPDLQDSDHGNLHRRAISRTGFMQDLLEASCVITNSGFELISECLHLGKRILAKPLHGQMEQLSNAAALEQLGYATVIDSFSPQTLSRWLAESSSPVQIRYPDVAAALAAWIAGGCRERVGELSEALWNRVNENGMLTAMAPA